MIQDIFPSVLYNNFDPSAKAEADDTVLCFENGKVLIKGDTLPKVSEFGGDAEFTYLFRTDDTRYFLADTSSAPTGYEYTDIRKLRGCEGISKAAVFSIYTGKHLADWYHDTRFCGRCGKKMTHSETERAMVCKCGYTAYPRIMPAVIVGVTNGDKLLLTKYRTGYAHNALVAGFTEIGETAEQTVSREVMEETGIRVKNIRYYKSQPWGSANDLLLGFYCDVDGSTDIRMDENELKYACWVKREDIELQPDSASLTNEMMKMFKDGLV